MDGVRNEIRPPPPQHQHQQIPTALLAELREAFAMFADPSDADRMGVEHLYSAMRAMGADATVDDVVAVVDEHDPDGHGHITFAQWTAAMAARWHGNRSRVRALRAALVAGDPTGSGLVTAEHARSVVAAFDHSLSAADVALMVAEVDRKGLGLVDYDEFVDSMVRPVKLDRL